MLVVAIGTQRLPVRRQHSRSGQSGAHSTRPQRPVVPGVAANAHRSVVWDERLCMPQPVAVSTPVLRLQGFPVALDAHRPFARHVCRRASGVPALTTTRRPPMCFLVAFATDGAVSWYDRLGVGDAATISAGPLGAVLLLVAPAAHGSMIRHDSVTFPYPTTVSALAPRTVFLDVAALTDHGTATQHELRYSNSMALGARTSRSVVRVIAAWAYGPQPVDHRCRNSHLPATRACMLGLDPLAVAGGADRTAIREERIRLRHLSAQGAGVSGLVVSRVATEADRLRTSEAEDYWPWLPTIMAWFDGAVVAAVPDGEAVRPFKRDERGFAADTTGSMSTPRCCAGACGAFGDVADNLVLVVADRPQHGHTILVTVRTFLLVMPLAGSFAVGGEVLAHAFCLPADRAANGLRYHRQNLSQPIDR